MLFVLSQFMFIVGLFVVPAQLLASVRNAHVDGALVYVVVNRENGDIYMATTINIAYMIHRLDGDDLRIMSSTEIIYDIVIFMIIDYRMRSLIVCTFHSCLPYELDTLTLIEKVTVPALGVVYFGEIVCTPTETNILAFFAGVDNDVLFIGTTPQILSGDAVEFEVPRIASRKSTQDENFLQFLSSSESGDKQSALFLSSFSRSYPEFSPKDDLFVYGFGHNGFSYFVGSFELADLDEFRTEARIARVCQSDKSYSSYMEVPLQCNQTLQGDTVLYRQAVTWAQLTTATPSLEMYVGQDVLYFIMSRDVLCVTSMADIEMAFLRNLDVCLNGADMKSAAPDLQTVTCPQNSEVNAQEVECNVPDNVPKFSGTVPIIGRSIMDVVDTRMGYVVNYGSHSVFVRIAWEKIHTDVITPAAGIFQEFHYDEPHEGCRVQNTLIRLHPDNSHVFIFENISSDIGFGGYPIAVTKVLLANCTLYNDDCSSCVSVAVCGWCSGERRCTMEAECLSGEWLQAEAASFYEYPKRQIHRSCLYIDLVGSYNLTFSPRSGLRIGTTKMLIYVTTEKALSVTEDLLSLYISDHLICPIMYLIHGLVYEYDTILDEWRYRFQCNVNSSEIPEEQGIVSLRYTDSNIRPAVLWLNSTEEIDFVVPTFKSFAPLKGPQAGGTLLEISGNHLLSGNYHDVVIAGRTCELIMDYSTDERLVCLTPEVAKPTQSLVFINLYDDFTLASLRRFTYSENPFIDSIFPLRTFVGGGEFQYVKGTNLDSIARPLFVVVVYVNGTAVDQLETECAVKNSTFMACPSPKIVISGFLNDTRARRSIDSNDNECNEITTTPLGKSVEFRIGFVLDNVQEWLPSVIQDHLDAKYTTISVARDPVYYMFGGAGNIVFYNPGKNDYLVIKGERLDCGATKNDITIEVGLAYCTPIISLYRTQLTCTPPPSVPPVRSEYLESHGFPHVLVQVGVGNSRYLIGYIDYEDRKLPIEAWIIAIAVGVIVLVLFAVGVVIYFVVRRMRRRLEGVGGQQEKSRKTEYETMRPSPGAYQSVSFDGGAAYLHLSSKDNGTLMDKLDEETRLQIQDVLIESSRIQLSSGEVLGKGEFGRVLLGDLLDEDAKRSCKVAVKSLKKYTDIEDVRKFLEEGIMMKDFKHPNVLSLIGVCIDDDDCPMIVLPYMKHGDLKSFIEKPERELTVGKIVTFSLQIAQGMAYLSTLKFVHRDLAARNCMVDESETVKVSDFGLSRDIYEREYYTSEDKKAKLPFRWMPLESIKKSIFNVKTDVWSYGVLVWELLTRGELPYSSIDNWDIPNYLERGRRLPQPAHAPDDLYEVMLKCWHKDPTERPEFETVVGQLRYISERGERGSEDSYYFQPVESPHYISLYSSPS